MTVARLLVCGLVGLALFSIRPALAADEFAMDPRSRAHFEDGMAQWKAGRPEAAMAAFEAVIDHVGYAAPFSGGYEYLFKKSNAWREDFRQMLLGPPDESEAHFFVGTLFASRSHWRETTREYEAAIRLKPSHAQAHLLLGYQWAQQRQWESAVPPLRAAVALAPRDPAARMFFAIVLGQVGRPSAHREAVEQAREAVRLAPDSPDAHWILSQAYLNVVERQEAAVELRAYLALVEPGPLHDRGIERARQLLRELAPYLDP